MGEKGTARERLVALLAEDPEITASEAAEVLEVSRQRVHQLLAGLGRTVEKAKPGRRRQPRPTALTGGVQVLVSQTTRGTIGELLVAADLLARGFVVFVPITRHVSGPDLLVIGAGPGIERIEVRTGRRREGKLVYQRPDHRRYDRLALVVTGEPVLYKPPFDEKRE